MDSLAKRETTSSVHRVDDNDDSSELCLETSSTDTAYGKPCSKRYLSVNDYLSITLTLLCFAVAIAAVQWAQLAAYLGVKYQLIVLGLMLTMMFFTTAKQVQVLLITLEARFGGSILQNYDAIRRNDKFRSHTSFLIRLALMGLYALPLGLGAAYKQFASGGRTTIPLGTAGQKLHLGPSAPPGLYMGSPVFAYVNATSALYDSRSNAAQDPAFPSSHGFNMHMINSTHTVMLDTSLSLTLGDVQASLQEHEVRRLTVSVGATYASLDSTPASPERAAFDAYWSNIDDRFGDTYKLQTGWGAGRWWGMWNGGMDVSLVFLSWWTSNDTVYQTFESQANGFNIYRGKCRGTWVISSSGIFLEDASDFDTSWSPERQDWSTCDRTLVLDRSQTAVVCKWNPLSNDFYSVISGFLVQYDQNQRTVVMDELSLWVATVVAMEWSTLASMTVQSANETNPTRLSDRQLQWIAEYPGLLYENEYLMTSTVNTMRRGFGLCAVLSVQPLFLLVMLLGRCLLYEVPVSENFGITTLLAGASRKTLDALDGAAFSGKLTRKVRVQIRVHDDHAGMKPDVQSLRYIFGSNESNSRLRKRKATRQRRVLLA